MSKSIEELRRSLMSDGWCVIEDVIPADVVPGIRQAVKALVKAQRVEWEQWVAESRAQGQRRGAEGVENAQGVINNIPECAPFVAE